MLITCKVVRHPKTKKFIKLKSRHIEWCCNELEHSPCFGFGNDDREVTCESDLQFGVYEWNPRWDRYDNNQIRYCPFCGKKIKIKEISLS